MPDNATPRPYPEWRTSRSDRPEDAAYTFGYHLMKHCRDEALALLADEGANSVPREKAVEAINLCLHNVMDLLEGFWKLPSGTEHKVEYALQVLVKDKAHTEIERVEISPGKLDLPIGFWKWVDGEFR